MAEFKNMCKTASDIFGWSYQQNPVEYSFFINKFKTKDVRQFERDYYKILILFLGRLQDWKENFAALNTLPGPEELNLLNFIPRIKEEIEDHKYYINLHKSIVNNSKNPFKSSEAKKEIKFNPFAEFIRELGLIFSDKEDSDFFEWLIEKYYQQSENERGLMNENCYYCDFVWGQKVYGKNCGSLEEYKKFMKKYPIVYLSTFVREVEGEQEIKKKDPRVVFNIEDKSFHKYSFYCCECCVSYL